MYANISHYIRKFGNWQSCIRCESWDEDGNRIIHDEEFYPYLYIESKSGPYKTIFGTNAEKREFANVIDRNKFLRQNPDLRIFECLKSERQYLIDKFESYTEKQIKFAQSQPLRIHFTDIETWVDDEFAGPDTARQPICVITSYDNFLDEYHTFVYTDIKNLKFDIIDIPNVKFHVFNTEVTMLKSYLTWFRNNRPDIFCGYNSERFDLPYIIRRCYRFIDENFVNECLSPVGVIQVKYNSTTSDPKYTIAGVSHMDYYDLYKNHFGDNLGDFKLETVCQHELGVGKYEYEGTIKELFKNNFEYYVIYNIYDVKRLRELESKKQFFQLIRIICNEGLCEYEGIYNTSRYITGALVKEAHRHGLILPTDLKHSVIDASYEGGYVFEPKAGIYRNGLCCVDLKSLYPNTIIEINISPETKAGKIVSESDSCVELLINGNINKKFSKDEFYKAITGKYTKAANGVLYIHPNRQVGIIPSFLKRFYTERKAKKAIMFDIMKRMEYEKEKNKKDELKTEYARCKVLDFSFKVFLNAIYGQLGNQHFALYDLDNAEAVTLSGQTITKESAKFIDNLFNNYYNSTTIVAGDTDSLMIDMDPFIKSEFGCIDISTEDNIKQICQLFDEKILKQLNQNCCKIGREIFLSDLDRFEYNREYFATHGALLAKKKYLVNIRENEGVFVNKWKIQGHDLKKKEIPNHAKEHLERIIYSSILTKWDSNKFNMEMRKIYNEFLEMPIEDFAWFKGYSTDKSSKSGRLFDTQKGAQGHARAAEYYNAIIEKLNLTNKYDKLSVGDILRFVWIYKNNKFGIDVIGFPNQWPEEFNELFRVNYPLMFEKIMIGPLKRFIHLNNWIYADVTKEFKQNIFDL